MALPSSKALYEKMKQFRPEPLERRDKMFEAIIDEKGMRDECLEMLLLLQAQTQDAHAKYTRVGDPWHGQQPESLADSEVRKKYMTEKKAAEKEIKNTLDFLQKKGVSAVRVDIALGANSEILAGYNAAGGSVDPQEIAGMLARLFNNCMFVDSALVTVDSTILQALTLGTLKVDSTGKPLPGELAKIEDVIKKLKERLKNLGIDFQLFRHNYAEAKSALTKGKEVQKQKPEVPVKEEVIEEEVKPEEQQTKPE
ncbi:MAG: hypothetical protein A3F18_06745 [Legionellales bacterium RIFCSPHIGHO2_12_FULL_37_14]|nr:MAG: hypothetical protein A3F18_06745 [Legionellales bacterium RIFCSPHIGHO2_12_FULL_37_14]